MLVGDVQRQHDSGARDGARREEETDMNFDIRARGFALTETITERVETRVRAALEALGHHVVSVVARVGDVNADRGGVDKECRIVATLDRHRTAVAHAVDQDLYLAIDEAARRLRRSAQRMSTKKVGRQRSDPQRPGTLVRP